MPRPVGQARDNHRDLPKEGYTPSNPWVNSRLTKKSCLYLFTIFEEDKETHKRFKKNSVKEIQGVKEYTRKYTTISYIALKYKYRKEHITNNN